MANTPSQCPFLVPAVADALWIWPVPAFCLRSDTPRVRVPARGTLMRVCTTSDHARCPGFRTSGARDESPGWSVV